MGSVERLATYVIRANPAEKSALDALINWAIGNQDLLPKQLQMELETLEFVIKFD